MVGWWVRSRPLVAPSGRLRARLILAGALVVALITPATGQQLDVDNAGSRNQATLGGRHADTTSIHGCGLMRDLRHGGGVHRRRSGGPSPAPRRDERRHAKDLVADRWSGAGL